MDSGSSSIPEIFRIHPVAAFRAGLQGSAIVLISSYAFTNTDSLDAPHLELYTEPFYLFELKDMDSHPALVVLSACRTGNGRMVTGEGSQSLARVFTASGVGGVVAGWWNVNDDVAAQLMQGFYASLLSGQHARQHGNRLPADPGSPDAADPGQPINAAAALQEARLGWLNDPAMPYLHKLPYYWSALNYQGNPTPFPPGFRIQEFSGTGFPDPTAWWWLLLILPFLFWRTRRRRQ